MNITKEKQQSSGMAGVKYEIDLEIEDEGLALSSIEIKEYIAKNYHVRRADVEVFYFLVGSHTIYVSMIVLVAK